MYAGWNPYASGPKVYGLGGRMNPTNGPVDKMGYRERDAQAAARRNALLRRMQNSLVGQYNRPNVREWM